MVDCREGVIKDTEMGSSAEEGCICTKEDGGRQRIAVTGMWGVDV